MAHCEKFNKIGHRVKKCPTCSPQTAQAGATGAASPPTGIDAPLVGSPDVLEKGVVVLENPAKTGLSGDPENRVMVTDLGKDDGIARVGAEWVSYSTSDKIILGECENCCSPTDDEGICVYPNEADTAYCLDCESDLEYQAMMREYRNLSGVELLEDNYDGQNFDGKDMRGAAVYSLDAKLASFDFANLHNADMTDSNFDKSSFESADLGAASLDRSSFKETNLWCAKMVRSSALEGKFNRANLWKADLSEARLPKANFSDAVLTRANFQKANLSNATLCGADLRYANFSGANLTGANLRGIPKESLVGANFDGAKLPEGWSFANGEFVQS